MDPDQKGDSRGVFQEAQKLEDHTDLNFSSKVVSEVVDVVKIVKRWESRLIEFIKFLERSVSEEVNMDGAGGLIVEGSY